MSIDKDVRAYIFEHNQVGALLIDMKTYRTTGSQTDQDTRRSTTRTDPDTRQVIC